jgi:AcrR family transcriptional regulator
VTVLSDQSPASRGGGPSRAGNAMERTRAGILSGARAGIVSDGVRRVSMARVAELGGVAKATVYNHVRSKPDLLALVAHDLVERAGDAAAAAPTLADGLVAAAAMLGEDPVVRSVARQEPVVVGRLLRVLADPVWEPARHRLAAVAEGHGAAMDGPTSDLVLRWLVTVSVAPSPDPGQPEEQVARLLR